MELKPQTLRTMGNVGIIFGVAGLAFTLVLAVLVATGASESPQTIMAVWVPIQSAINLGLGWSLRRRAGQLAR